MPIISDAVTLSLINTTPPIDSPIVLGGTNTSTLVTAHGFDLAALGEAKIELADNRLNVSFNKIYIPDNRNIVLSVTYAVKSLSESVTIGWGWEILSPHINKPTVEYLNRTINTKGRSTSSVGQPEILLLAGNIRAVGFNTLLFSNTSKIENVKKDINPKSFVATIFGVTEIYNLKKIVNLQNPSRGIYSAKYGTMFMGGGVKTITVSGFSATAIPSPKVVNTRANQTVNLHSPSRGIAPIAPPNPNVSPRILYPRGILGWSFGTPWVQRNPSPKGFVTDSYGTAWVSHSPRYLKPDFVKAFESGYAKIFDPTQYIRHADSPHIPGGIFGDIGVFNQRRLMNVLGTDQSLYGDWSNVYSNLIKVGVQSFDAALFGDNVIWNKTPSVIPKTWDNTEFGLGFVSDRIRRVNARGFGITEIDRFGRHVLTKPPELFPRTFLSQVFGQTTISNRRRFIFAGALDSLVFKSDITVWFRYRHLNPVGIKEIEPGKPKIEHGLRTLLQKGSDISLVSTPTVWFKVRSILAPSIYREFETRHTVGGTQFIKPDGYVASLFGTRIVPENQGIYGTGFNAQGFTENHRIELHTRWVRATGFLTFGIQTSDRYGTASVWNKRQYIQHNYDSGDGLNPGAFGQWTSIVNRNREIKVSGFNASRLGYTLIDNKARPLLPSGKDHSMIGSAMIADRVRYLKPQGMESPYLSGWGRVHNTAFVIAPLAGKHDQWGKPTVVNTRREYRWIGAFESMQFGNPMIAFRIRKLSIESRYSIAPIYMPLPKVDLYTRYIDPPGPDLSAFGGPSLHIKWNTFTPRWTHRELFGDPSVRNLTPELRQRGNNSEEFGHAGVKLYKQYLSIDGYGSELLGKTIISYRDRSMSITGRNYMAFGLHKVVKTGAPPYSLQQITLDWDGEGPRPDDYSGKGIEPPERQVSIPTLKTNVIFTEGFVATRFGNHHAQSNGILLESGIQEFSIGNHFVGLKNRTIQVPTLGDLLEIEETRPRVSPHTIYAVMEAPAQAIKNHPSSRLHFVNSDGGNRQPGEVFGWVTVTNRHRTIRPSGSALNLAVSEPRVQLRKRYIKPQPFNSFRMGWHYCSDGSPQHIEQYDSENMQAFGHSSIVALYYGPQNIRAGGLNANLFGVNRIEHFHRIVRAVGSNMLLMGAGRSGDTPYKPQGLWVGEPKPTIPKGFNAEVFGDTRISLRVRDVTAVGFDSFISEMDISNFKGRMKVTLVKKPVVIEPKEIKAESFGITAYGVPNIRLKTHYIRPDGNSDQYRKGAPK